MLRSVHRRLVDSERLRVAGSVLKPAPRLSRHDSVSRNKLAAGRVIEPPAKLLSTTTFTSTVALGALGQHENLPVRSDTRGTPLLPQRLALWTCREVSKSVKDIGSSPGTATVRIVATFGLGPAITVQHIPRSARSAHCACWASLNRQ